MERPVGKRRKGKEERELGSSEKAGKTELKRRQTEDDERTSMILSLRNDVNYLILTFFAHWSGFTMKLWARGMARLYLK